MVGRNQPCPCGSGKKFKVCCLRAPVLRPTPQKAKVDAPALIVCMPTRGNVTIETVMALSRMDRVPVTMRTTSRLGVVEARNKLAEMALAAPEKAGYEPAEWFVLWIDSDAFWPVGTVATMLETLQRCPEVDILCGFFGPRSALSNPTARYADGHWVKPGTDCNFGEVVEIARTGFHFTMHRLSALEKMPEKPFTDAAGEGEDYAFCAKARQAGLRIWVHTGLPVAHIGDDGFAYLPGDQPYIVVDGQLCKSAQAQARDYGPGIGPDARAKEAEEQKSAVN